MTTAGEIFPGGQVRETGALTENPVCDVGVYLNKITEIVMMYCSHNMGQFSS